MTELETFQNIFENWVLSDIQLILKLRDEEGRVLEPDRNTYMDIHRPFISAVILISCAIDCLAGYRYGRGNQRRLVGQCFKDFVKDYFPGAYDDELVYTGIRNATVHCYSTKKVGFSHTDKNRHLTKEGSRIIIDVFCFYDDLEKAYEKYKTELIAGQNTMEFNEQVSAYPIIRWIEDENIKADRSSSSDQPMTKGVLNKLH